MVDSDVATAQAQEPALRKPLRLWPGVVAVALQWLGLFVVPIVVPDAAVPGMLAGLFGVLAFVVWWTFFSRLPWLERLGAIVLIIVAMIVTPRFLHESLATAGMGILWFIYAIPTLCLGLVLWAAASPRLPDRARLATMAAALLLVCGAWTLVRTGGVTGGGSSDFAWRWSETPEERLLAQTGDEPAAFPPAPATAETGAEWPGFRGPDRDSIISGVRIETDWSVSPPVELWRRPVGPGWSSFAVHGDLVYTQEQRGDDEVVACYRATTGEPVWKHRDAVRFWESNGGAGPRATPTLGEGRVYTLGATGILNVLDAGDGNVVWSRNAASDTDTKTPIWGFAGSPLVVDDVVIVAVSGTLAAYDLATGDPRWFGPPAGTESYSSPHPMTIDGVAQILLINGSGVISVAPADGTPLWEHPWPGAAIAQPARTADGDVLISALSPSAGKGIQRLAVAYGSDAWTIEERWTSNRLKPYFNDFVVHQGHAFGFDGSILACIDLEDGERKWKGGRYGHGQLVLLADQDLLLVVSEKGELALVAAAPDRFAELARLPAIEGKTWNHPAVAGDLLLVRNSEEMVAFRLP